jgi:hypothetical protein
VTTNPCGNVATAATTFNFDTVKTHFTAQMSKLAALKETATKKTINAEKVLTIGLTGSKFEVVNIADASYFFNSNRDSNEASKVGSIKLENAAHRTHTLLYIKLIIT